MLSFDITNEESFEQLKKWMNSILEHGDKNVCIILVGNKIDLAA